MWMINDFLVTLSYPVGARPAILLVLVMQRIAYLNGCTNQKICYMGHERFKGILRHTHPQGRMSYQV